MSHPAPPSRAQRNLVRTIDRALVRLIEERARILAAPNSTGSPSMLRADALRRASGDVPAAELERVLEAIERACSGAPS